MPYIAKEKRGNFDNGISELLHELRADPDGLDGNLNYIITTLVAAAIQPQGAKGCWRYRLVARAIAVFECAKLEFYRRVAAVVETNAINNNGDIQEYQL